jgi:hypothetical protein
VLREIAFWVAGLLVVVWAFRDFNRGLPRNEIRFSTQHDRYVLGVLIYAGLSFVAYFISAMTILALYSLIYDAVKGISPLLAEFEPLKTVPSSISGALVVVAVLPEVPVTRRIIDRVRLLARSLALYPHASLRMLRFLGVNSFHPKHDPEGALDRELGRFGACVTELQRQLSPSVFQSLSEIQSLHEEFQRLKVSQQTSARSASLHRFFVARQRDFAIAERNYQRLMRKMAQISALDGVVAAREGEPYPLSDFATYATERLLNRCRSLLSQAALSCFAGGEKRQAFIERFGYTAPPDWLLPIWPFWAVLIFDAALFLVPTLIGSVPAATDHLLLVLFLIVHGLAQVLAVSWAILPKATSNFARPSLFSFPWRSYVLFGLASYASGILILLILNYVVYGIIQEGRTTRLPLLNGIDPYLIVFVISSYFPAITVCLSFLTDLHLRRMMPTVWIHRVLDGSAGGVVMALTNVLVVRQAVYFISRMIPTVWIHRVLDGFAGGVVMALTNVLVVRQAVYFISGSPPPTWAFVYVVAAIGFLIGLTIPATAAVYLGASETQLFDSAEKRSVGRLYAA